MVKAVTTLLDRDPSELTPLYSSIDHVIANIFSDPPKPDAQVEITFT
ncbi:HalOD1 output domain-containing protein [Natrialbaceae archaeon A-CW3]